jgi:hypothetical protein
MGFLLFLQRLHRAKRQFWGLKSNNTTKMALQQISCLALIWKNFSRF